MHVFAAVNEKSEIARYTMPFLRAYCDRHGYPLTVAAPPADSPRAAAWQRLIAPRDLPRETLLLIDETVVPLPDAPAIANELAADRLSLPPANISARAVRQIGAAGFEPAEMRYNSALIGCPPDSAEFLARVYDQADLERELFGEQGELNWAIAREQVPVHELSSRWNSWIRREAQIPEAIREAHFVRFAGNRRRSLANAKRLWERFYQPSPPRPATTRALSPAASPPRTLHERSSLERGVILYNRGVKCLVRMLVALHSLRKWWQGPVTVFVEGPHPPAFLESLAALRVSVVRSENPDSGAFIRKVEVCFESPYERTIWLDSDTIICGPIEELFESLDQYDVVTPHFAGWSSAGRRIRQRIEQYRGKCPDEWLTTALEPHPAVNMGVFAFKRNTEFLQPWLELSKKGDHRQVQLPEEIAFQILYPRYRVGIVSARFGVSVKHDPGTDDIRIVHYHGQKHVHEFPLCALWKQHFEELLGARTTRLHELLHLADRRLKNHLRIVDNVTIVTACDANYVQKLRLTFPTWVSRKHIARYPVLVFVHGIPLDDARLDFLRLPSVQLVPWDFPVDNQRERMLSAFVFGVARHVSTRWWLKLDADAYAVDDKPLMTEEMKAYAFCGHRWGLSRAEHIRDLDSWALRHPDLKIQPMFDPALVAGDKFRHPRTQSFAQMEQTRFTSYCARLAGERLPAPSHDTFGYYVADRLGWPIGRINFKREHGMHHCSSLRGLQRRIPAPEPGEDRPAVSVSAEPLPAAVHPTAVHPTAVKRRSGQCSYYTFSNRPEMTLLEYSLARFQVPCTTLGRDVGKWRHTLKIELALEVIDACPTELAMFCDGFDVLFLRHPAEIVERFLESGASILFNGQLGCWPRATTDDAQRAAFYDSLSQSPYRYLNAGCYIGYCDAIKRFLLRAREIPDHPRYPADDQCKFQEAHRLFYQEAPEQTRRELRIDDRCELFQVFIRIADGEFEREGTILRNTYSGTYPIVVHAANPGRNRLFWDLNAALTAQYGATQYGATQYDTAQYGIAPAAPGS